MVWDLEGNRTLNSSVPHLKLTALEIYCNVKEIKTKQSKHYIFKDNN